MNKYIHYGHKHFKRELFIKIQNYPMMTKPKGGLWASNVESKYGWEQWNNDNKLTKCDKLNSFSFILQENSRVLHVYSVVDLLMLPIQNTPIPSSCWTCLNFEKLIEEGYDAIELHLSEEKSYNTNDNLYFKLYGWDCDSILIMNPDIVVEV